MPIEFTCPHCQTTRTVADEYAGQSGPCRSCGEMISIPDVFGGSKPPVTASPHSAARTSPPVKSGGGGSNLVVVLAVLGVVALLVIGALAALLIPAVSNARVAARRMSSSNNMKQIMIAVHNYHDVYRSLPTNIVDENGEPRSSWRTAILPFLEQAPLYDQYNFNVSWDHPDNSLVRSTPVNVFLSPLSEAPPTHTNYVAVTDGQRSIIVDGKPKSFAQITDGTSNTIMLVEVEGLGIQWSEPRDITVDELIALMDAGKVSGAPQGFHVAFADASVRFLPISLDRQTLRDMVTCSGGETVAPTGGRQGY